MTRRHWTDDLEIVGVAATKERGQVLCEEDWDTNRIDRRLRWDEHGAYYFMGNRRRSAGYEIEPHTVV